MRFRGIVTYMTMLLTRRRALALSSAALVAGCADNKVLFNRKIAAEQTDRSGLWSSGVSLPFPVQEIYPCAHNSALHLAGGFMAENGRITGPTAAHHAWKPAKSLSEIVPLKPIEASTQWQPSTPLPTARHHPQLISFKGHLLALAGFQSPSPEALWVMQSTGWRIQTRLFSGSEIDFDRTDNIIDSATRPQSQSQNWAPLSPLPSPCAEAVIGLTGDGLLHVAGGRTPRGKSNMVWTDHVDTNHHFVLASLEGGWERAAPCLSERNSAAGDVINGNLHVVGGRNVRGGNVATHEVYDTGEDRWRTAAPMPQAQGGLAAAAVNNKLYVFGGEYFDAGGGVYKEGWAYDPATDTWTALPDMPNPRHGLGAVALDGKIYVMGGALEVSGVDTSAIVDVFTPS